MTCPQYALGTTASDIVLLSWLGIPFPVQHTFQGYSVVRKAGNSDMHGYGYPVATWIWSFLNQAQVWNMLNLFPSDDALSADLYITTYNDQGYDLQVATYACKAARPLDGNGKTLVPRTLAQWSNVTMRFYHMILQP